MAECREVKIIARIRSDFATKFGIPRQSGLADALMSSIVFEPEFRNADALRGLEGFSHLWLVWEFSEARKETWSPTVRPPRLGGNKRMGVFATRSPFRPNPIGLSAVRLDHIQWESPEGPVLHVAGADLMDGTPIYDMKPYLPYADCIPQARGGFAAAPPTDKVRVEAEERLLAPLSPERRTALLQVLACDPRPSYQADPERVYGMSFAGWNVRFRVAEGVLTVLALDRDEKTPQETPHQK